MSFSENRQELFSYIRKNYPDVYDDFNDISIGTMFIDLLAYLENKTDINTNNYLEETNIDDARLYHSLMSIAKRNNISIPGKSPSVTLIDLTVKLPVNGNSPNLDYAPLIIRGAQFIGAGQSFETLYDVDFSSPFSKSGTPNRTITPIYNNSRLTYYEVTKSEIAINGVSKFYSRDITINDSIPFLQVILPDPNVIEVTDVITLTSTSANTTPTLNQLYNEENRWEQVGNLSQQTVFKYDSQLTENGVTNNIGNWKSVNKRFTFDYTDKFFARLTFGGGKTYNNQLTYDSRYDFIYEEMLNKVNEKSMGEIPSPSTTLFVKYRIGGGISTNVGANTIKTVNNANIIFRTNNSISDQVRLSLSVNNPIPSLGGNDEPSLEELRNIIKKSGVTYDTIITESELENAIRLMPSKYGRPYKTNATVIDNKFILNILNLDENGNASPTISSALKTNIVNFISNKISPNVAIEVQPTKIINYGLSINLIVDNNIDRLSIESEIQNVITEWSDKASNNIGKNLNISSLYVKIGAISGIISISSIVVDLISGNPVNESVNGIIQSNNNIVLANYNEFYELSDISNDVKLIFNVL